MSATGHSALLQLDVLELGYGGRAVLQDLNLQVSPGQWIALLGPNACGKTTLLRCLAGQLEPQRGTVQIEGRPLYPVRSWRGLPGYAVPPEDLPPFLTLRQCLEIHAQAHALDGVPEAAELLFERLGLTRHDQLLVRNASFGTRQKLSVVLAMMRDPPILLLDEIFNGLDFGSALALKRHLHECVDRGLAVLLATHSLDVVLDCCDGLVLLDAGRMICSWDSARLRGFRDTRELEQALAGASRSADPRP